MKHLILAICIFLFASSGVHAQFGLSGMAPLNIDQSVFTDNVVDQLGNTLAVAQYQNTAGKTTTSCAISTNTLVLFAFGQSIDSNTLPTAHTPTNTTHVKQLNIYDKLCYQAKDPLLGAGATTGNYLTYLADKLVTDGKFTDVILIPEAVGGTGAFDWSTSGVLNQRIRASCIIARGLGWFGNANAKFGVIYDQGNYDAFKGTFTATGSGTNLTTSAVTGIILPPDVLAGTGVPANTTIVSQTSGTPGGAGVYVTNNVTTSSAATLTTATTAATWQATFANIKASMDGIGGCGGIKWFVPTDTMINNAVNASIQAAQAAVVDGVTVFAGANTDGLTGANRQGDGTHLSDAGGSANANLWATVIEANY